MRPPYAVCALVLASCVGSPPSAPDAGRPVPPPPNCVDRDCVGPEVCVERDGAPACLSGGECDVRTFGRDLLAEALGAIELDRCHSPRDEPFLPPPVPARLAHDPFRLPHADRLLSHPLEMPGFEAEATSALPPIPSLALAGAARLLGRSFDPIRPDDSAADTEPLVTALAAFIDSRGGSANLETLRADAADVPDTLQRRVAVVLAAMTRAGRARDAAFAEAGALDWWHHAAPSLLLAWAEPPRLNPLVPETERLLTTGIDWSRLYRAAFEVAAAVEDARFELEPAVTGFTFDQPTPAGRVVLADAGAQTWEATTPITLLVDIGGDDTYRYPAGANASAAMPVALHVDVAGDDTYAYAEHTIPSDSGRLPSDGAGRATEGDLTEGETARSLSSTSRQGAGRVGIGMLHDLAGNDRYRSLRASQGFGALGVGVLFDGAGDDLYEAEAGAQGSASLGIGLLVDAAGADTHRIYAFGQGFGHVGGLGALVDGGGDDVYFANPGEPEAGGDPLYASAQLPGRGNTSMVQGAGFGLRADAAGYWMSGGLGVLVDLGDGADDYICSVFGQGTGYWFGTGLLRDGGGDDLFDGRWYVRGASAHMALAMFHDLGGNDRHGTRPAIRQHGTSYGTGHDLSVAWLVDDAGNDTWTAPGLSLGAGNACGWGVMLDGAGDDRYSAPSTALGVFGDPAGCSFGLPERSVGILLDRGGIDHYELGGSDIPRSDALTEATRRPDAPRARGVHVDAADANLLVLP